MGNLQILFFLAALAIIVTVIHILLKQSEREEYAYLVLLIGVVIALIRVVPFIVDLFREVESVFYFL